jgi:hypothetical protein
VEIRRYFGKNVFRAETREGYRHVTLLLRDADHESGAVAPLFRNIGVWGSRN